MLAYSCFVGDGRSLGASALDGDCRCGLTLTLGVNTKLGTLSLSKCILLPRIHDELGGSQQTLQRRLGRIGRILLEGLLQIVLKQSVGAIILAGVMEVSEDLFEFAEEQRLRIGWHVAKVGQGRDELLRELLAGLCDVGLVDRDGLPHRLTTSRLTALSNPGTDTTPIASASLLGGEETTALLLSPAGTSLCLVLCAKAWLMRGVKVHAFISCTM